MRLMVGEVGLQPLSSQVTAAWRAMEPSSSLDLELVLVGVARNLNLAGSSFSKQRLVDREKSTLIPKVSTQQLLNLLKT